MAEKLSQQPAAQVGTESDIYYIVQAGQTRRQTRTQLRTAILSAWQGFIGTFLSAASPSVARSAIGAISSADDITGSAAKLTTVRSISVSGDGTWTVNFDGSANVTAALTLASNLALAGNPTAATQSVGNNTTRLANTAYVQAEIANKRAWTGYTPTITPTAGTFTSATAVGSYMVAFGMCYVRIQLTVTTKGTGTFPTLSLPFPALAGHVNDLLLAREVAVSGTVGTGRINAGLTGVSVSAFNAAEMTADGAVIVLTGAYPIA